MASDKSLFGKFETLVEDMFGSISSEKGGTLPARRIVDSTMYRTTSDEKTMTLEVDLPGANPSDVTLSYTDGRYVVEAPGRGGKKVTHYYTLSSAYDPRSAQATIGNGQLKVVLNRFPKESFKIGVKII